MTTIETDLRLMLSFAYGKIIQRFQDREPSLHAWREQLSLIQDIFLNIQNDGFWLKTDAAKAAPTQNMPYASRKHMHEWLSYQVKLRPNSYDAEMCVIIQDAMLADEAVLDRIAVETATVNDARKWAAEQRKCHD